MKKLLLATIAASLLASTTAYARPLTSVEKLSYIATALTMCKSNPDNSPKFCYCFSVSVAQEATTEDIVYTQKVGKLSQKQEIAISTAYTACSLR
jgi:hypothetical protein